MADIEKIRKANAANILAKLKAGRVLTPREIATLSETMEQQAEEEAQKAEATEATGTNEVMVRRPELADLLGVTERRVNKMTEEKVIPKADRGKYPLKPCVKAYLAYINRFRKQNLPTLEDDDGNKLDKEQWTAKYTKRRTEKLEFEMAILRGQYVASEQVRTEAAKVGDTVRKALMRIPPTLAPVVCRLNPANAEARIAEAINEALAALTKATRQTPEPDPEPKPKKAPRSPGQNHKSTEKKTAKSKKGTAKGGK